MLAGECDAVHKVVDVASQLISRLEEPDDVAHGDGDEAGCVREEAGGALVRVGVAREVHAATRRVGRPGKDAGRREKVDVLHRLGRTGGRQI